MDNLVAKALEETRKRTKRELDKAGMKCPKGVKYTVLYREANHDEKHKVRMEEIRMYNKEFAPAFDLKGEFFDLFECGTRDMPARISSRGTTESAGAASPRWWTSPSVF